MLRLIGLAISLCCIAVLTIALWLEPNKAGVGTHTTLPITGMQPCQFLARTGLPCPSCGMTTSFALMVRGRELQSFYNQPMGALLCLATAITFWVGLYVAATGRPVYRLLRVIPGKYWVLPLMLFVVVAWAWKIFIHLRGIDGW